MRQRRQPPAMGWQRRKAVAAETAGKRGKGARWWQVAILLLRVPSLPRSRW